MTLFDGDHFTFAGGRHLGTGGPSIPYELYKDAALTQVWGDSGYGGLYLSGTPLTATGTGLSVAHTVFGKLLPGGSSSQSSINDTIVVTLIF